MSREARLRAVPRGDAVSGLGAIPEAVSGAIRSGERRHANPIDPRVG